MTYEISVDGKSYERVFNATNIVPPQESRRVIRDIVYEGVPQSARYVRVSGKNIGLCPPWHKGSGGKAWLFVDEVDIR